MATVRQIISNANKLTLRQYLDEPTGTIEGEVKVYYQEREIAIQSNENLIEIDNTLNSVERKSNTHEVDIYRTGEVTLDVKNNEVSWRYI